MKVDTYKFPNVDAVDVAFSTFKTIPELKQEAIARGFDKSGNKWCDRFYKIFYSGSKLKLKEGHNKAMLAYLHGFIRSWDPKHEEKEMICAMLLSELENPL